MGPPAFGPPDEEAGDERLVIVGRASPLRIPAPALLPIATAVDGGEVPWFLAAATTGLGFAWKSGVAAEILSLPKRSVGYMLYESKLTLETADLFAWTLLVVLLSMLIEWLLSRAMRRIRG